MGPRKCLPGRSVSRLEIRIFLKETHIFYTPKSKNFAANCPRRKRDTAATSLPARKVSQQWGSRPVGRPHTVINADTLKETTIQGKTRITPGQKVPP